MTTEVEDASEAINETMAPLRAEYVKALSEEMGNLDDIVAMTVTDIIECMADAYVSGFEGGLVAVSFAVKESREASNG